MTASFHRTFGFIATAIVLVAIVWGFVIIGTPGSERARKFDEQRISDLRTINSEILSIVRQGRAYDPAEPFPLRRDLPKTLDEVVTLSQYTRPTIIDAETGAPYEYTVTSGSTFELCAVFNDVRDLQYDIFWNHTAGRDCFSFDATKSEGYAIPEINPVITPSKPI